MKQKSKIHTSDGLRLPQQLTVNSLAFMQFFLATLVAVIYNLTHWKTLRHFTYHHVYMVKSLQLSPEELSAPLVAVSPPLLILVRIRLIWRNLCNQLGAKALVVLSVSVTTAILKWKQSMWKIYQMSNLCSNTGLLHIFRHKNFDIMFMDGWTKLPKIT